MPIRDSERGRYPPDWPEISRAAKERAGWKCQTCGAPHNTIIARSSDKTTYMLEDGAVFDAETGEALGYARGSEYPYGKVLRVILTTAHLDHIPEHCDDANLKVLCQMHHLRLDATLHAASAAATRRARKATGDLFA